MQQGDKPARKAISKKTRFDVFKRDLFICQYCGAHPPGVLLHVDHVIAVANGGANDQDNLVTACEPCNAGKGARKLISVPESLASKAKRIAESEAQLIGYQEILENKRERLTSETWRVVKALHGNDCESVDKRQFMSIRMFVEKLGIHECLIAMERAVERVPNDYHQFKYFCGTCWRILKASS